MKIRWREHERMLVTVIGVAALIGFFRRIDQGALSRIQTDFASRQVPFDFYRNALLPDLGLGLLIYGAYLFVNLYTLRPPVSVRPGRLIWILVQGAGLVALLGTAFAAAGYYKNECYFRYPGFTFFPGPGYHPQPETSLTNAMGDALRIVLIYALYAAARETAIYFLDRAAKGRKFLILLCNQITAFLVLAALVPFVAGVLHLGVTEEIIDTYFSVVIPAFLLFLVNIYWIFPLAAVRGFFSRSVLLWWAGCGAICSLPAALLPFHADPVSNFITCWAILLSVVTLMSWLYYQQRKDKLVQLKGVEKALLRSKTDLQILRLQINPHFLFNVLNTLYGSALQEEAPNTATGIQKLGDMMRFMLHGNDQDFIDLEREKEYLQNYISLQKLRLGGSPFIKVEDEFFDRPCPYKIAPMLLIPFVENAFKYGVLLKEQSWVKIRLQCTGTGILFEVSNSVHRKASPGPGEESPGIGINNVMERLRLIYPGKHRLSFGDSVDEFSVRLFIDLL